MKFETGRANVEPQLVYQVTWFAPDRPVDGGTLFIRPTSDDVSVEAVTPPLGKANK